MKTPMPPGNPPGISLAQALPRLVASRRAVRRPQRGRVAVHGAVGGVAGVVATGQGGAGSHLHLTRWHQSPPGFGGRKTARKPGGALT